MLSILSLTKTAWGFSVEHDNPFAIFPHLQGMALSAKGREGMIDLSRGDPGCGYTPSMAGRRFFGYLLYIDSVLNTFDRRYDRLKEADFPQVWEEIVSLTREHFPVDADTYLQQWEVIFIECERAAREQGLPSSRFEILRAFFGTCVASGGSYLDPHGEPLFRAIVADWHHRMLTRSHSDDGDSRAAPFTYQQVMFTNGASHAIGSLFAALGSEGAGYLNPGDIVLSASPLYSPYNEIFHHRGLKVVMLTLDPVTGRASPESWARVNAMRDGGGVGAGNTGANGRVKLILIVDPHNPTGTSIHPDDFAPLLELAEKDQSIMITDEVYFEFFPEKESIFSRASDRMIRISARSKIERSTGLRFGDIVITKAANVYLTELLRENAGETTADIGATDVGGATGLPIGMDFWEFLLMAKSPGGTGGEFFHTTFVPGPSQAMGVLHMLLGGDERQLYVKNVARAREIFCELLELPHRANMYYILFDLNATPGATQQRLEVPIEEKLTALAKMGLVYLPAYRFFDEADRKVDTHSNIVRASFVNASVERMRTAAEMTLSYMRGG